MIGGRHSIAGWPSGTSIDSEDTLAFKRRAQNDQFTVQPRSAQRLGHRLVARGGREHHLGSTKLLQLLGDVLGPAVDVMVGAELARQRCLVLAAAMATVRKPIFTANCTPR